MARIVTIFRIEEDAGRTRECFGVTLKCVGSEEKPDIVYSRVIGSAMRYKTSADDKRFSTLEKAVGAVVKKGNAS